MCSAKLRESSNTMIDSASYASLRQLLEELGFTERTITGSHVVFEHSASDLVFFFRLFKPTDLLTPRELYPTRKILDARGLMDADRFDELLSPKSPRSKKAP
jgi:predicted RNA binding protein YcfA (HicA-like mRNA interferase family)